MSTSHYQLVHQLGPSGPVMPQQGPITTAHVITGPGPGGGGLPPTRPAQIIMTRQQPSQVTFPQGTQLKVMLTANGQQVLTSNGHQVLTSSNGHQVQYITQAQSPVQMTHRSPDRGPVQSPQHQQQMYSPIYVETSAPQSNGVAQIIRQSHQQPQQQQQPPQAIKSGPAVITPVGSSQSFSLPGGPATAPQQQAAPVPPMRHPSGASSTHSSVGAAGNQLLTEIKTEPGNGAFSPSGASTMVGAASPQPMSPPSDVYKPQPKLQQQTKKGPAPRPNEELCLVCGDKASGYHYNALACEGCKGFFRRSITKDAEYKCKYGGACEMDMYMRRKCQACRLIKCYSVGMKAECVVPESQCKTKRDQKEKKKAAQTASGQTPPGGGGGNAKKAKTCQNGDSSNGNGGTEKMVTMDLEHVLQPEEEELINRLVYHQKLFENPSETDLTKVYHVPLEASVGSESEQLFKHMTEMTILTVQLIVDFSKELPGFQNLNREDQIILLKGCSSEVMMLRGARKYDPVTDSIVFATNHPFTKDNYVKAGLGNEDLFRFCRRMTDMKVDNAEFALVTAIDIFSQRHGLQEARKVEKIQEIYVDALESYVMANRKKEPMVMFSKLLSVLTELRTLGYNNSRQCIELRMERNKKLPDFLEEIWDLK